MIGMALQISSAVRRRKLKNATAIHDKPPRRRYPAARRTRFGNIPSPLWVY
jgi:hypothetical protein